MYGVSPAWFLSLFGEEFSCGQAADSLNKLKSAGFLAWQPEIFFPERLKEWEGQASHELHRRSDDLGMTASQFVAHFLLNAFNSREVLHSDWGISQCRDLLSVLEDWQEIKVITVPIPALTDKENLDAKEYPALYEKTVAKLKTMTALIEKSGRRCGLEILPGALIDGSNGFLQMQKEQPELKNLGVNLDTGHFNAMSEDLKITLERIGACVTGTHLCDNDGITNLSLPPGEGTVNWTPLKSWKKTSPLPSIDIEIRCPEAETVERYTRGLNFLKDLFKD